MGVPRILLVDDNSLEQKILSLSIKRAGAPVQLVGYSNPEAALEYLRQLPAEEWPDFVVVDINMPKLSGFDFYQMLEAIKAGKHAHAQFFLASAYVHRRDIQRAQRITYLSGILEKPLTLQSFYAQTA